MARSTTQTVAALRDELAQAQERIEELEEHIRDGASLLDVDDLEEALDEADEEDEPG